LLSSLYTDNFVEVRGQPGHNLVEQTRQLVLVSEGGHDERWLLLEQQVLTLQHQQRRVQSLRHIKQRCHVTHGHWQRARRVQLVKEELETQPRRVGHLEEAAFAALALRQRQ